MHVAPATGAGPRPGWALALLLWLGASCLGLAGADLEGAEHVASSDFQEKLVRRERVRTVRTEEELPESKAEEEDDESVPSVPVVHDSFGGSHAPVHAEIEPAPVPDRTIQKIAQKLAKHTANLTKFVTKMRRELDEVCLGGRCQQILDKLERNVKLRAEKHNKYVQDQLPVAPEKPPWALRDSADWSDEFSTSLSTFSPPSMYPVDKVKCIGRLCGSLQLHYLEKKLDASPRGAWTEWFDEFPPAEAKCPTGHVVMRMECSGIFCSKLRLLCDKPDDKLWRVDDSATEEMGWFSEHHPGVGGCTAGYALYGMRCSGTYCHSKKLLCKGTKAPKRDCTWGPWSEWGECRGICGLSFQHRNRSISFPELWGGLCRGDSEGKKTCSMPSCTS